MYDILIGLIVITVILYLVLAIYFNKILFKYILKPGTMVLIIWLAIYSSALDTVFSRWIILGSSIIPIR
jgi:hypothetical protein